MTEAEARARLSAAGVDDPGGDAARLRRAAADDATYRAWIDRRAAREPVARILGRRSFWAHEFTVTPDVLDPRPDTETLVEVALAAPFGRVLDLGTGSGCILVSLLHERADATGLGTDVSAGALAVAARNAEAAGVGTRASFRLADWFEGVEGTFDLIVSNPPYIAAVEIDTLAPEVRDWDPRGALTPGGDGLDAYRAIAAGAGDHLALGGRLAVEIGTAQASAVTEIMAAAGLTRFSVTRDLNGRDRVVSAIKSHECDESPCHAQSGRS